MEKMGLSAYKLKKIKILIITVFIALIPFSVFAATLLAREEYGLKESDNANVVLQKLVDSVLKKANSHPCITQNEKAEVKATVKYGINDKGIAFAEVISNDCGPINKEMGK